MGDRWLRGWQLEKAASLCNIGSGKLSALDKFFSNTGVGLLGVLCFA